MSSFTALTIDEPEPGSETLGESGNAARFSVNVEYANHIL